jgi:acetyl-CoA acetyltransferase
MTLHRKAAVTGIGETEYSKTSVLSDRELQLQAVERAIADAGLKRSDIDGVIPSSTGQGFTCEGFSEHLGLDHVTFSTTLFFGGANGLIGMHAAALAVASGAARHVVVVAGRNGFSGAKISARPQLASPAFEATREFESPFGATVPMHFYALMAQRHMHLYGSTSRQFGTVAITQRAHATLNSKAIMKAPMSLEDHQASRQLVDPLRLFDCCIESDGAAAYIVSAADAARDSRHKPAWILGIAEAHPDSPSSLATRHDVLRSGVGIAAPRAFGMAGISPQDLRAAMLYDPFSFLVILQLEALGYCKPGEGGPFVEGGGIGLKGALPTNTHGGLLSQAHSMAGINHICEAVKQLRGTAGTASVAGTGPIIVTGNGDFGDGAVAILAGA